MLVAFTVWIVSLALFSFRIASFPLWNWDEAWYAEIISNMATGKYGYLVPFWNGHYYFDKPPLYFWLTLPITKIFGIGEWQERIVGVFSSSFAVLFLYLIASKLKGKATAILTVIIFLTLGSVWFRLSTGNLDGLQLMTILGCFYFYLLSQKHPKYLYLSAFFLGLSALVKSWFVSAYILVILVSYSLCVSKKLDYRIPRIFIYSLLVNIWWYLLGLLKHGQTFFDWYIFSPGAGNFSIQSIKFDFYYLKQIFLDIGVWFVPLIYLSTHHKKDSGVNRLFFFITVISLIYFIVINLSAEKFHWYLLPIYPFIAFFLSSLTIINSKRSSHFLYLIIFLAFLGQSARIAYAYLSDPDRSRLSADIGKLTMEHVDTNIPVFLDDNDFSGFLYYSGLDRVTVVSPIGGKSREPWIISYQQLRDQYKPYYLVTSDWQKFQLGIPKQIINLSHSFQLVRFDTIPPKL